VERLILENLAKAIHDYDQQAAVRWTAAARDQRIDPLRALDTLTMAIRDVGDAFGAGECFLPELVSAAEAMQAAMPIIETQLHERGAERESAGKVIAGTVAGDIHNIGKSMLCTLLVADGFQVIDLGEHQPDAVALSALLTITAAEQKNIIDALNEAGMRDNLKVIVGGGAINEEFAAAIGADGYEPTAPGGVKLVRDLLGK
jgi:methanogenic corrinoid protein MtbC1